jgi:PAS domain S-box-containing protein
MSDFEDKPSPIEGGAPPHETAREVLEQRVQERTQELARSLSLLHATLESTTDGVLAVDRAGQVVCYNGQFAQMWGIPAALLATRDQARLAAFANAQTRDPVAGLQRLADLQAHPETEACDVLELKDGRVFERFVKPQRIGEECVGSVLTFRDITERRRAEEALRRMEELYRWAIAGAEAVPYAYDYRTRSYQFMGEGIERLIGYRPEELGSELWTRIVQETIMRGETTGLSKAEAARRVSTGELRTWRCDMRVLTRAGKSCWLSDASVQHRDASGQIIGSVGILQDITERKEAEAELAYQRDLLQTLLANLPDAIFFKDRESRFVHYSQSLPRRLHVTDPEALRGQTDADFFSPEHACAALEDEQAILRTGQPMLAKVERETHIDGRITWALTSKMPWRDKAGHIIGTFGIAKDITAFKDAEAKLEVAHRKLVAASRQAGMAEVATSVLHNVGNVLNSVNVSSGLIDQRLRASSVAGIHQAVALLEKNRDRLPAFLAENHHAEQLLSYLKALARQLEAEQATVLTETAELTKNIEHIKEIVALQQTYAKVCGVIEIVSLPALIEDALRMHLEALAHHGVRVVREFEPLPELPLDKHKVLQILVNLISNAKYALVAAEPPERLLTVRLTCDSQRLCISVRDNGMGIAPENLTRIFSHGFTTRPDGHGFGLHSGALAAREMGGALLAHSDGPNRGATFILELPLALNSQTHEH